GEKVAAVSRGQLYGFFGGIWGGVNDPPHKETDSRGGGWGQGAFGTAGEVNSRERGPRRAQNDDDPAPVQNAIARTRDIALHWNASRVSPRDCRGIQS